MKHKSLITIACLVLLAGFFSVASVGAHQDSTSDLLLPHFEVDMTGAGVTTFFTVVNSSDEPLEVRMDVFTNWGIHVLDTKVEFKGEEVKVFNLTQWVLDGQLPDRTMSSEELEHCQAALMGQASPKDDLFYSDEVGLELAVGYVTIRSVSPSRPNVLFGDYFVVDPIDNFAQGELLVDIDLSIDCENLCTRRGLRFLQGAGFDEGTQVLIWSRQNGAPAADGILAADDKTLADILVYSQSGELVDQRQIRFNPLEVLTVADLGLSADFGWFDVITDQPTFMAHRHSAQNRFSVGLRTVCLPKIGTPPPPPPPPPPPAGEPTVDIEKSTNGFDADSAPGPVLGFGDPVLWEYVVTNTGETALLNVVVTDDQGVSVSCPQSELELGESMTCTGNGTATEGQYRNVGTVTAESPEGDEVTDEDPSHYLVSGGGPLPVIDIEKHTNGHDADTAPGPSISLGQTVTWTYIVTNIGTDPLQQISVSDDQGVSVSCPATQLGLGESMTCTGNGTATLGQYRNVGTARGIGTDGITVTEDTDPSHYYGQGEASIDIEKATNGQDADAAPGPKIREGNPVLWTYLVTNTGNVDLTDVTVSDDRGVAVACPTNQLAAGDSMECTGNGTAVKGQYRNVGTATGRDPEGNTVRDDDPSHYYGDDEQASIDIEKATNGYDADVATGPMIHEGDAVNWTYVVTNSGLVALSSVTVTDDQGVSVSCPKSQLQPGESMTCTGNGTATLGQYANIGTATGISPTGKTVDDYDPSHYLGYREGPSIDIEKATNGHDADSAPGPSIYAGDAVTWTYVVTNTGDVKLTQISVSDDQGVSVSCPKSQLDPGHSMTCSGNGTATLGQYRNVGTATGKSPRGTMVEDDDPSHYHGYDENPLIKIEKATNGHDADAAPGPSLYEGDAVIWTYTVTNTGDVRLTQVSVTDDQGVAVSCPTSQLDPGQTMTCTGHGTATLGQYRNIGTVTGKSPRGTMIQDDDPSHYYGDPIVVGDQGCTPGYWKNHTDSWPPAGLSPSQSVDSVFGAASSYSGIGSASLLEALNFGGGGGADGAARILLRASVAGMLNASHPGVSYPGGTPGQIASSVNSALASGDRNTMLSLATAIDNDNNSGCPLN